MLLAGSHKPIHERASKRTLPAFHAFPLYPRACSCSQVDGSCNRCICYPAPLPNRLQKRVSQWHEGWLSVAKVTESRTSNLLAFTGVASNHYKHLSIHAIKSYSRALQAANTFLRLGLLPRVALVLLARRHECTKERSRIRSFPSARGEPRSSNYEAVRRRHRR